MDATTLPADQLAVLDMIASRFGKAFAETTDAEGVAIGAILAPIADHGLRFRAAADAGNAAGTTRRWSPASAPEVVQAYNHALSIEPATLFDAFMLALMASVAVAKGAAAIHTADVFGRIAELLRSEGLRLEPWNPQWDDLREMDRLATEGAAA